ncbi:PaaI family thioesterase [Gracilibacillus xinjiangensis]|uniref:PaaI family thioesterase n=1 Tax=Gracilibacillus xinjiangensis TaxID=1193282 RepID=A0ABV8X1P4_9BACI
MSNLLETLGMKLLQADKDTILMEMPITEKVKQPMGYLHGGASVALAETAASIGGLQHIDQTRQAVAGLEINCNHIKAKKDGYLIANAIPLHVGKKTMVWEVKLTDESNDLIAVARCTLAVVTPSVDK